MRSLVVFLLGVLVGGMIVLYLPATRRDELSRSFRQQVNVLQAEVKNLASQLKSVNLPKFSGQNGSPSPTPAR